MQSKISRVKIAKYIATELTKGNDKVISELAAYLVDSRRVSELDLIVREIDEQLERQGDITVRVTTARQLDGALREKIAVILGARTLNVEEIIDKDVLGGVKLETASRRLDATIARRINALRNTRGLKV